MFWLCAETYQGSGRLSRTWIEEGDERPDTAELCEGTDCYCQGNWRAHVPYPFNEMGGHVISSHESKERAIVAEGKLWDSSV